MKIAFYTLGCKVNQYETQSLKESFYKRGFEITEEHEKADIYVINTCTVTGLADRKSRQYIRRMKKQNPDSVVAVIGCYAQVNPEEAASIYGVDLVVGNNEKEALPDYISELMQGKQEKEEIKIDRVRVLPREELTEYEESGSITTMESRTRAYIKIQDGCNQFCSYCIIPYARGPIRSRSCINVVKEAKSLLAKGFKELVLTGINTALYGMEKGFVAANHTAEAVNEGALCGIELIIKLLNDLPGDFRIRLGSLEPTVVNVDLAKSLLKYDKLCHHMHLSLQSGSDRILRAMNRHYSRDEYLDIVKALREADAHYGLTTDVIVGFPGETNEDFDDSVDMIQKVGFLKTHVFPYSKRQGTRAAEMKKQVDTNTKKIRSTALSHVAETSAQCFLQNVIGSTARVLFEEYDHGSGIVSGYSDNYIKVYCPVGEIMKAQALLNTLQAVTFIEVYADGVRGSLSEKA